MTLKKIKNPVEYSFFQWINNHPDSTHWKDKERFLIFVKTTCRYKAKKWQSPNFIKKQVLKYYPDFDADFLEKLLHLHGNLIEFHKTSSVTSEFVISEQVAKSGHYIEISVRNGEIVETEVPLKEPDRGQPLTKDN